MQVTLIKEQTVRSFVLPEKVKGQFWVTDKTENNLEYNFISIEAINEKWVLKSNKNVTILVDQQNLKSIILEDHLIYRLRMISDDSECLLFTEPVTVDRQTYKKVQVPNNSTIRIGRAENNDIVCKNRFFSTNHAILSYFDKSWNISDKNSTNGTFVNGVRVTNSQLNPGDLIYIMGFKIIIGNGMIAINNPDGMVNLVSEVFEPFKQQSVKFLDDEPEEVKIEYFSRSPRFKRNIEEATFRIDNPPASNVNEETPILLVMGPALTMGLTSMTTGLFAVNNAITSGNITSALPSIVMSFSMLLGTLMWPTLNKRYEKRRKAVREAKRIKKYNEYLDYYRNEIEKEILKQKAILKENSLNVSECLEIIEQTKRNLWERNSKQDDFLKLKIGNGDWLLDAKIMYSERRFTLDEDDLQEKMLALCETEKVIENVPISLSIAKDFILGIIGDRNKTIELAESFIYQISSYYGYDEVKLVFIYDEGENKFDFVKWLPHCWSNDRKFRFIATNSEEMKELSSYFDKEIEYRSNVSDNDLDDIKIHYVVFALDRELSIRSEFLKQILAINKPIKFSVLSFYEELRLLPKECSVVIELEEQGRLFDRNDISGKSIHFETEVNPNVDNMKISSILSNIYLDTLDSKFKLPKVVSFLEMFNVGKVEHLNANIRWKDNDPTKTLQTEVGVDAYGGLFKLDLHEKFHGPHGLVAGMTGSGKSEFIISYILSLAVNYHPNEVAFILIDYKGGGMAKSFENLPHTAGIITNLDGSAIKRSLISIESELKRRQALFADAGKRNSVSNIDIYKYQKLFREGSVSEPLQHLFIISDEFAELKTQQPEFMAQLISAARIGRSLGIHLILATQKPAGVVDDQIWSNSKFRVCLKVQERADSMDMLKRPDAAELTDTGRFYLQVGYNELFEIGQSAWAGAPYIESDKVITEKDNSVVFVDRNGRILSQLSPNSKSSFLRNPKKQLDIVTEYLMKTANDEKIKIRPLWLDPIPAKIDLEELSKKYNHLPNKSEIRPLIGEIDDPRNQQQKPLYIPISDSGNIVVYGSSGSGKTEFVSTLVYSIIREVSPEDISIYLLDFSSEFLRAFASAPHVGDVILSHETEKIGNLFKMIKKEIDIRKKLFASFGGDFKAYNASSDKKVPTILIGINNYAAFLEVYSDGDDVVYYLSREGSKYGINFILTSMSTNSVRFKLLQNIKQQITLQLNDDSEYSTIVGKTDGLFPAPYLGRGLIKIGGDIYEFQTASIESGSNLFKSVQDYCKSLSKKYANLGAKKIPVLPERVSSEFLADYINETGSWTIPLGIEKNSLQPHYYPFGSAFINMILSAGNGASLFTRSFAEFVATYVVKDLTLFDSIDKEVNSVHGLRFISKASDCEDEISSLFSLMVQRNNSFKDSVEKGLTPPEFDKKTIVINSLANLKSKLTDEGNEKLSLILEKGDIKYNVMIIISETTKNVSSITYTTWFKKHINVNCGLWIGSGITDQFTLKINKTSNDMYDELSDEFGFSIINGKQVLVKLLNEQEGE